MRDGMDEKAARRLGRRLVKWYGGNARDLPWRRDPTPYSVWISEIMLQQTVVGTVAARYADWMKRFPDVRSLAESDEREVLAAWAGLGYYSRAKNLKRAAAETVRRYGGALPADYGALVSLPGLGEYTAGAVASIAFSIPVPAVDGNVLVSGRVPDVETLKGMLG